MSLPTLERVSSIEPEKNSKVVCVDRFDPAAVNTAFKEFFKGVPPEDDESRLYYFTPEFIGTESRMGLFGDFAPSVILSAHLHNHLTVPFRETYLREFGYSKLCHLYCTLDKSVMFDFFNRHMARSKVYNLNSAAMILGRPELQLDSTLLKQDELSPEQVIDILMHVKKNATQLLIEEVTPIAAESHQITAQPHTYEYPSKLEALVQPTPLTKILLYGSSAKGEGSDFDNFGILERIPDNLYTKIRGSRPNERGKEVGVIFVPEEGLENFLYINVSNTLFRSYAKSLKGSFEVPIESSRYQIFKEMYHAGFGSAKLLAGLNLVYRRPDVLFDKPGLFDYFMKLNRFSLHGLLQKNGYVVLDKKQILEQLRDEFHFTLPPFKADAAYLQECFLRANETSINLAAKLYDPSLARTEGEQLIRVDEIKKIQRRPLGYSASTNQYIVPYTKPLSVGEFVPVRPIAPHEPNYQRIRQNILKTDPSLDRRVHIAQRL